MPNDDRITVKAFDYASSYDLRIAKEILEQQLSAKILHGDPLLAQLDAQQMIGVFKYGAVVFFNLDQGAMKGFLEKLSRCAHRPYKTVSEDDFVLYLTTTQKKPEGTSEWFIKEFNRDIALLVGIVLSRSVSVEYYEKLVADALAQLEEPVNALAQSGWLPKRTRDSSRQVGFALSVEVGLAYDVSVFDDPDVIWDGGKRIQELYAGLKREFDLEDRINVIQRKVSIISRSSDFVISRLEAQRSRMLEWIIIILILAEIVLALLGQL